MSTGDDRRLGAQIAIAQLVTSPTDRRLCLLQQLLQGLQHPHH